MENRTKHTYRSDLYSFLHKVLVVCPVCKEKATVFGEDFTGKSPVIKKVKVVCTKCGFNKTLEDISKKKDPKQNKGNVIILGAPVDPYFHLPLWVQSVFESNILWAYNDDHLQFLEDHVSAKLRERNGFPYQVRSVGARLPRWMTSSHNRESILKLIKKLKDK